MKLRTIISAAFAALMVAETAVPAPSVYQQWDEEYQRAHDPIRRAHVDEILNIVGTYYKKTGHLPLESYSKKEQIPFMAVIGRNEAEEDYFANFDVLKHGAGYVNSWLFEQILSEGLGQNVQLPRDPQTVATYAPNVYLYFIDLPHICGVAHLYSPSDISKEQEWEGGKFHSHAKCYEIEE